MRKNRRDPGDARPWRRDQQGLWGGGNVLPGPVFRRWLLASLFLVLLLVPRLAIRAEALVPSSGAPRAHAGRPVPLDLDLPPDVRQARLHYRAAGAREFFEMVLPLERGMVQAVLPAEVALPPGVEYYLELILSDGRRLTDPPYSPRYNPYHIRIERPSVLAASVAASGSASPTDPVVIALDRKVRRQDLRVLVDGADVSASVVVDGDTVTYLPPAPFSGGGHRVVLSFRNGPDLELPFDVRGEGIAAGAPRGVLRADGTFSFNYGFNTGNKSGSTSDRTSANLHVGFSAKKGDFSAEFSGINLQYVKDAPDEFTISSGYLFRFAYGVQELDFGDLSITETPLTVAGYNRRGAQLRLKYKSVETSLFNVGAHTVEGFRSGMSLTDSSNQVYGAAVKFPLLGDDRLSVHLSGVTGKQDAEGFNTGSTASPSAGDTVGLRVEGTVAEIRINGEFAASWYDPNTTDGSGKRHDSAFELNLDRDVVVGNLSFGLLRYGTDFASIANPNFTGDRQALQGSFSSQVAGVSVSLDGSYSEDNVGNDPSRPVVGSTRAGIRLSGSPLGRVSLNLGYGFGRQESREEPTGAAGVDNLQQDVSFGFSISGDIWNAAFNGSLGFLDDRLPANNDTDTRNLVLSGGVNTGPLSILPNISWNETESPAKTDRSRLVSLSFSIPVWKKVVDLSGQGSYQLADASDDSVDTRTTNGSIRLAWNVQDVVRRLRMDWMNVQFAFSASYNRLDDRKNPANTNEDYVTFLALNLGAPYRFGGEMEW